MRFNKKAKWIYGTVLTGTLLLAGVLATGVRTSAEWKEEEQGTMFLTEDGAPTVGFMKMDGHTYYFDKDGYLKTGKFYVESEDAYYYADKKGIIQTGMIKTKKVFYMADETGKLQTGFMDVDGEKRYFLKNGDLAVTWFKDGEDWYYANSEGILQYGFIEIDGYRYYLDQEGKRVSDAVMEIDGETYVFNADGSVDENATTLYPVYQYVFTSRKERKMPAILLNTKVQACALTRAAELVNGFAVGQGTPVEDLLKNRGVKSQGGYTFSYGGMKDYGVSKLLEDMKQDPNLKAALADPKAAQAGLGMYVEDDMYYYELIIVCP